MKQGLKDYGTMAAGLFIVLCFCLLSPDKFCTLDNFINISRQISLLVIISMGATLVMIVDEFDLSLGLLPAWAASWRRFWQSGGSRWPCAFAAVGGRFSDRAAQWADRDALWGAVFHFHAGDEYHLHRRDLSSDWRWSNFSGDPAKLRAAGQWQCGASPLFDHSDAGADGAAVAGDDAADRRPQAVRHRRQPSGRQIVWHPHQALYVSGFWLLRFAGRRLRRTFGLKARFCTAHGRRRLFFAGLRAVFLGRTVFKGGVPNIWGTFIGAAILGVISNGLTIMKSPSYAQDMITGVIIILAVSVQKAGEKGAA